jgi:hypothetical protein
MGVDLDPQRISEANANAEKAGVTDKVTFHQQNLFDTRLDEASVVTMYLLRTINLDVRPRLFEQLKPGTRVVSHAFDMGDWEADHHETVNNRNVFMWIMPGKAAGRWTVNQGERQFIVDLNQQHQMLTGTATIDGRQMPVRNARMNGKAIEFTVQLDGRSTVFRGEVDGDMMQGREGPPAKGNARTAPNWRAQRMS